ncbi:hypothetical protein ACHAWO_002753 [Cyclotella atomus]|uniref:F-box domain-containing protein n=1 Tax=Cyclotella atomus TaxID=382360 RepID=A0ABD3QLV5_9STRA
MASNGNYKSSSPFGNDGNESLDKISFNFNEGRERSWCTSSDNSSCCSLCHLNEDVNEDENDMAVAYETASMGDLQSTGTLNEHVLSSGNIVAAARPTCLTIHNNINNSMFAASGMSSQQPITSCHGCTCYISTSMMAPSLFGTCGSCQSSSLLPPAKANFMTQFAIKNNSFLSREEKLSLQSLLFPASIPKQTDLLTAGFLSEGPLYSILSFLDVNSLVNLRFINTKLRSLASDNSAGWRSHCTSLWAEKVRVCPHAKRLLDSACTPADEQGDITAIQPDCNHNRSAAMEAYKASILEAKNNNELSEDDLCFDLARGRSGVSWSFRFKESAGIDWTSWDPWWNNQPARNLVFMRNGSILQSFPQGQTPVVTTHNSTPLYDVFSERMVQRNGADVPAPRIEMRWRFVSSCMDLPRRPDGAYVRITVGGRDVPTHVVRRSPNGNWGFIMESCWSVYASFELGAKNASEGRPASSSISGRRALRRTRNGSRWVNIEEEDENVVTGNIDDEEAEATRNVRRRPNPNLLVDDSAMTVSGVSQWREALLYNIGAVTLPEGNDLNQFNAAWQNALLLR